MEGLSYQERNAVCLEMGYRTYQEYQQSVLWAKIRIRVFNEYGWNCVLCGVRAGEIHHDRYTRDNLEGRSLEHLHAICNGCHKRVEITKKGEKRPLEEAQDVFRQLKEKRARADVKKKPNLERVGEKGYCSVCGDKAKKGSKFCTPHKGDSKVGSGGRPEIGLAHKRKWLARKYGRN